MSDFQQEKKQKKKTKKKTNYQACKKAKNLRDEASMRTRLRYDTDFEITKQEIMISMLTSPVGKSRQHAKNT